MNTSRLAGLRTIYSNASMQKKIIITAIMAIFILAIILLLQSLFRAAPEAAQAKPAPKSITLLPITSLATTESTLDLTGTLRNKSEASLRFEVPGRVTGVYAKVGAWVRRGALIAQVENASQRAQLTQALGALNAAKARAKASKSQLSRVRQDTTAGNASALTTAHNTLSTAYASTNQAIINGTDDLFRNPSRYNPKVDFNLHDSDLRAEINAERIDIRYILDRHADVKDGINDLSKQATQEELDATIKDLTIIKKFLDKLLLGIDKSVLADHTTAHHVGIANGARTAILGQIQALSGAKSALSTSKGDVGATEASLEASNASVTTALGSYQAAQAQLAKTQIYAPISGTIASLSLKRGDFVTSQEVGRIIGNGGNEVVFYIPSTDAARIKKGDAVLIASTYKARITSVSKSAHTQSQQIEIIADLTTRTKLSIPNGSQVAVQLIQSNQVKQSANSTIKVPITAIKFTPNGTIMFTASSTSPLTGQTSAATSTSMHLIALPVTIGTVVGSLVEVSGIDPSTAVLRDARGFTHGQEITVRREVQTETQK